MISKKRRLLAVCASGSLLGMGVVVVPTSATAEPQPTQTRWDCSANPLKEQYDPELRRAYMTVPEGTRRVSFQLAPYNRKESGRSALVSGQLAVNGGDLLLPTSRGGGAAGEKADMNYPSYSDRGIDGIALSLQRSGSSTSALVAVAGGGGGGITYYHDGDRPPTIVAGGDAGTPTPPPVGGGAGNGGGSVGGAGLESTVGASGGGGGGGYASGAGGLGATESAAATPGAGGSSFVDSTVINPRFGFNLDPPMALAVSARFPERAGGAVVAGANA